jgi:diadenosine tetraphosphatase ApaH/serine/threonine PP2A family protein phosphatase
MKLGILSDIHANLEALAAVFADMETRPGGPPDRLASLGDLVGYGPDPEAVMALVMDRGIASVLGNHEMAVLESRYLRWFNPVSRIAVEHSIRSLSPGSVEWIRRLPRKLDLEGVRLVHGVPPASPFVYLFQVTDAGLLNRMDDISREIVFVGHTHDLALVTLAGSAVTRRELDQESLVLEPGPRYIVNAGSVGQPRDGDPSAKYLVFDTRTRLLEVRFVPYPFEKTAGKILDQGLPRQYADRLSPRSER